MHITSLPETRPHEQFLTNGVPVGIRASHPAADVYETNDDIVVELDVAGFCRRGLAVEVGDHRVVVTGTRDGPTEARHYLRHERLGPRFVRAIDLAHGVDETRLRATYDDGVLVLSAPRVPACRPRWVPIEAPHGATGN
jgi:HSP20 family protein